MLVFQILKGKSDDAVVTVPPGSSVADVAEILSSRRIGAVIISKDGEIPQGILSERDIVRELGKHGSSCMDQPVETIMTSNLIGCSREDTADYVLEKMTEGRFRHMPVLENSRMVGLISIGDVVKARLAELSMEKDALEDMITGH